MNVGMLWFDNDRQTALADKVLRAAEYYQRKYGHLPDMCLVHPSMLVAPGGEAPACAGKVSIRSHHAIRPGHLWIGQEERV